MSNLKMINQQFLFAAKNENGHTDFYKVCYADTGIKGTFGASVIKNGITYNTLLRAIEQPSEKDAADFIQTTFINDKIFHS